VRAVGLWDMQLSGDLKKQDFAIHATRVFCFLAISLRYSRPEFLHTSETTEFHLDFSTGLMAVRERAFDLHQSGAAEEPLAETLQTITMPVTRPGSWFRPIRFVS